MVCVDVGGGVGFGKVCVWMMIRVRRRFGIRGRRVDRDDVWWWDEVDYDLWCDMCGWCWFWICVVGIVFIEIEWEGVFFGDKGEDIGVGGGSYVEGFFRVFGGKIEMKIEGNEYVWLIDLSGKLFLFYWGELVFDVWLSVSVRSAFGYFERYGGAIRVWRVENCEYGEYCW